MRFYTFLIFATLLIGSVFSAQNISECKTITQSGTYNIVNDIDLNENSAEYSCFEISASDVTIDCQDKIISSNNEDAYFMIINGLSENIKIKNCNIEGFPDAIVTAEGITIENSQITNVDNFITALTDTENEIKIVGIDTENVSRIVEIGGSNRNVIISDSEFDNYDSVLRFTNSGIEANLTMNGNYLTGGEVIANDPRSGDEPILTGSIYNNEIISNNYFDFTGINYDDFKIQRTLIDFSFETIYGTNITKPGNYWGNSAGDGFSDTCTKIYSKGICSEPFETDGLVDEKSIIPIPEECSSQSVPDYIATDISPSTIYKDRDEQITCTIKNAGLISSEDTVLEIGLRFGTGDETQIYKQEYTGSLGCNEYKDFDFDVSALDENVRVFCQVNVISTSDTEEESTENNFKSQLIEVEDWLDLSISDMDVEDNDLEAGDSSKITCRVSKEGNLNVPSSADAQLVFKIYDFDDSSDDEVDIIEDEIVEINSFPFEEEFNVRLPRNFDEDEDYIKYKCEIEYSPNRSGYEDIDSTNDSDNICFGDCPNDSDEEDEERYDGVDIEMYDVDTDEDEYNVGDIIDIDCKFRNRGLTDSLDPREDDVDIDVYLYIDGDRQSNYTESVNRTLEAGEEYRESFFYKIPFGYDDDRMKVECRIDYDIDDEDDYDEKYQDDSSSDDRDYKYVDIEDNGNRVDLSMVSVGVTPPYKVGETSTINCTTRNIGSKDASMTYDVTIEIDGVVVVDERSSNKRLDAYESYTYSYDHTWTKTGPQYVNCSAKYNNPEDNETNNSKSELITVTDGTDSGTDEGPIIGPSGYVLDVISMEKLSFTDGVLEAKCVYENTGSAQVDGVEIIFTKDGRILKQYEINTPLYANSINEVIEDLEVGYDGGEIACLVSPTDSDRISSAEVNVEKVDRFGTILIVIGSVLILAIIIFLILKFR